MPDELLQVNDEIGSAQYPGSAFIVLGFRANGMLVDAVRHGDDQEFCIPIGSVVR